MLSAKLDQTVRIASVPEPLRRLARRVGGLRADVRFDADLEPPRAVVELLKLRDLEPDSVEVNVTPHEGAPLTWIERGNVRFEALAAELEGPLELLLRSALSVLVTPEELVDIATLAETELTARAALSAVVEEMLSA